VTDLVFAFVRNVPFDTPTATQGKLGYLCQEIQRLKDLEIPGYSGLKFLIADFGIGPAFGFSGTVNDLADGLSGEVALFDIDRPASEMNKKYGNLHSAHPDCRSKFTYSVSATIESALRNADFVICSINPGPLALMKHDLGLPWKEGIIQTVGDTVGPGGIIRAMRAIPIYEYFARQIRKHAPNAWVINHTNHMTVLTRTLTKTEPSLKRDTAFQATHGMHQPVYRSSSPHRSAESI